MDKKKHPDIKKINHEDLEALLERAQANELTPEDCECIRGMADTIEFIIDMLYKKDIKLKQMLKQILGIKTERTEKVKESIDESKKKGSDGNELEKKDIPDIDSEIKGEDKKEKKKGHGKTGAESFTGAERVFIANKEYKSGDSCPECPKGKLYELKNPGIFIHIEGKEPLQATIYELEKLRCNLCGIIIQAELPIEVSTEKQTGKHYDETAKSMMAIMRYGYGVALNRMSKIQSNAGVPISASTIWEKTEEAGDKIYKAYDEIVNIAAQGEIVFNDDTVMKILELKKEIDKEVKESSNKKIRTGIFTTGIVSKTNGKTIVLFFTGRKHAGENFDKLISMREPDSNPPLQMCDGKRGNTPKDSNAVVCNCNAHARRYFVDAAENYPDECLYVIVDIFGEIYKIDAIAKKQNMSAEERLEFHKEHSGPVIDEFYEWMQKQFDNKQVEPNSELGRAISYFYNHFNELTQFLRVPGAPLDNNICERALKMAILHRKNSLFYKTEHGAYIGDMFMSIIHTCNLNGVNAFDYITKLQNHSSEVFKNPGKWLPWNYRETLASLNFEKKD